MHLVRLLALLLGAVAAACLAPAADPALGTVRVALGPSLDRVHDWRPDQRAELVAQLATMAAAGPAWVLAPEGEADVVVRAADLSALGPDTCGHYRNGERFIELDASCTAGYLALRRAMAHELLHWLTWTRWRWVGHLCWWPRNEAPPRGCHPTRLCVDCLLAPGLTTGEDPGPGWTEAYVPPVAHPEPTAADRELIVACQAAGRCE